MSNATLDIEEKARSTVKEWRKDWCMFARDALGSILDPEQEEILRAVQHNPRVSVASGTSRGKDYIAAVAAVCFMYLTPKWDEKGELIANTKVALTAPSDRQVGNIMVPEISRLYKKAKTRGVQLPGRLVGYDIRTDSAEWFLTGFKADDHNHEAWTGFHAVNTMFVVTEASGIPEGTFEAIEGNLQGNSRFLIVFNPNKLTGYAARSQRQSRWTRFQLNSLNATNVVEKRMVIPGQVDYDWVRDKLDNSDWCTKIREDEINSALDDFQFEGQWYRPEDVCRKKILGKFPKIGEDNLIPRQWIEEANERWKEYKGNRSKFDAPLRSGVDVAGMGRDKTVFCDRYGNYVLPFYSINSGGKADHMKVAGLAVQRLKNPKAIASIDTIGEGAGVYSRLDELGYTNQIFSCKWSNKAEDKHGKKLKDYTGEYEFRNMRAYCFWAVRDWLNPKHENYPMLPPDDEFMEEASDILWSFMSNGLIEIEKKDDIKERLGRSIDKFDALASTFAPFEKQIIQNLRKYF